MAARFSDGLHAAGEVAARGDELRARALELADADADAYGAVLQAYRMPKEPDGDGRRARIRDALGAAADVPLDIALCAEQVGDLAARLARDGNPNLRGDAVTAAYLAEAAARSAVCLVELNVTLGGLGTGRVERAGACCEALRAVVDGIRAADVSGSAR